MSPSKRNPSNDAALRVLESEATAIRNLMDKVDASFLQAVELAEKCKGKIVVAGLGKSGINFNGLREI